MVICFMDIVAACSDYAYCPVGIGYILDPKFSFVKIAAPYAQVCITTLSKNMAILFSYE